MTERELKGQEKEGTALRQAAGEPPGPLWGCSLGLALPHAHVCTHHTCRNKLQWAQPQEVG